MKLSPTLVAVFRFFPAPLPLLIRSPRSKKFEILHAFPPTFDIPPPPPTPITPSITPSIGVVTGGGAGQRIYSSVSDGSLFINYDNKSPLSVCVGGCLLLHLHLLFFLLLLRPIPPVRPMSASVSLHRASPTCWSGGSASTSTDVSHPHDSSMPASAAVVHKTRWTQ